MHLLLLLPLIALTAAQNSSTYWNETTIQSAPFNLVILSQNQTLNGSILGACHDGAAQEALCASPQPSPSDYQQYHYAYEYQFNVTYSQCYTTNGSLCSTPPDTNPPEGFAGTLTWGLPLSSGGGVIDEYVQQALHIQIQGASSNMAFAVINFQPSTDVAFDQYGRLNIQDSLNADKTGFDYGNGTTFPPPKPYYRWWLCDNTRVFDSYGNHLTWVYGEGSASSPECQKVDVYRRWV